MGSPSLAALSARCALAAVLALTAGCAGLQLEKEEAPQAPPKTASDIKDGTLTQAKRRSEQQRIRALEREVERLKTDLTRAENTLVSVESGLRAGYTRADAVSALAEAQMQLNKGSRLAPWHEGAIQQAREKLDLARQHIDDERFGAAIFFVYRANRIIEELQYESQMIRDNNAVRYINKPNVNIREGPSTEHTILSVLSGGTPVIEEEREDQWALVRTVAGLVGWVHISLLSRKPVQPHTGGH